MLPTCIEELQLYTLHAANITGGEKGFQICPQETILLYTMKTLKVANPGVKM
jgi:ABC-type branched-subunit amino acid transport system permease subunit